MGQALNDPDIQRWIAANEGADVAALALAPFPFDPSLRAAVLDQIKARRKARDKTPIWAATPGIIFPPTSLVEQASSEATAAYKASIAGTGETFVDLTAGMGVDTAALAARFTSTICVEADAQAADLLRHNLPLVTGRAVDVLHDLAERFVERLDHADLVFVDPQRRLQTGRKGLFRLADCTPDIASLLPRLAGKAAPVMLKTSPMLDIAEAIAALPGTYEVHVVEWQGQCREVLYLIRPGTDSADPLAIPIHCVTIDDSGAIKRTFSFTRAVERDALAPLSDPLAFLFEPGPAVMKGGGFDAVAQRFGLMKLHPQTHLYTGDNWIESFPGRGFQTIAVLEVDRKTVLSAVPSGKAHLKLRNFPGDIAALQKRLGLAEGGDDQLFACTLRSGKRAIVQGRRLLGPD